MMSKSLHNPTNSMVETVDEQTIIARMRALKPFLQEEAVRNERLRSLTKQTEAALREAGAFKMFTPRRWGGSGMSVSGFCRAQVEVGKGDLAAAWVLQILNTTTWIGSLTSDALQETLFAKGPALICGVLNPPGKARQVDGGYKVSGRWPYSSGSAQADWMMAGCQIINKDDSQAPGVHVVYLPMSQVTIVDSWFVTGLQGTGSDTVVADDVFVPDHMVVKADKSFGYAETRKRHVGATSDRLPILATARMGNLAQLLGGAQQMLELIEADVIRKPLIGTTYAKKSDAGVIVHDIGRIAAQLDNAELILFDALKQFDDRAAAGEFWSDVELSRCKAQGSQVVGLIHRSIEEIMFLGGSSAFALSNPLQRYWRDIHIALRHILHMPQIGYELYGRDRMGLKPNISPPGSY